MLARLRYVFFLKLTLLIVTTGAGCYFYFSGHHILLLPLAVLFVILLVLLTRSHLQVYSEVADFAESVRYRDFTRHYQVGKGKSEVHLLRNAFNEISAVFKEISVEREIQYQYLQNLLDIVDTGILSYEIATGKVIWMNESFRKLFAIPYLHTFEGLKKRNPDLYSKTTDAGTGSQVLLTVQSVSGPLKVLLHVRDFQTADGSFRMATYQNVNEAIDKTESQAWQKLLSVLTHEIMNSIAPISSLAGTITTRLEQYPRSGDMDDIRLGVGTIKRRSEGLLKFAQTYRSLNKVSHLQIQRVPLSLLFENLYQLFEPTLLQKHIELDIILSDTQLQYDMDGNLIEQVLINLVLNAIEAVKEQPAPYISVSGALAEGRLQIKVTDNGKGIPAELIENIFIPFFTTKKSGSGVGLTLGKQIMLLHGGNIMVDSREDVGSTFTLQF